MGDVSSGLAVVAAFPRDLAPGAPDDVLLVRCMRALTFFYSAVSGAWGSPSRMSVPRVREEERRRIARDIHDEMSQMLTAVFYRVEAAERVLSRDGARASKELSAAKDILQDVLTGVDRLIWNLRQPAAGASLFALAEKFLSSWEAETGIPVVRRFDGEDGLLSEEAKISAYRILQEACANVRKHSRATTVEIEVCARDGILTGRVADNGVGFDPARYADPRALCFGLVDMKERAECLGGRLEIRSAPSKGTVVVFEIPALAVRRDWP